MLKQRRELYPIILTFVLFFVAVVIFVVFRSPNINLWIFILLYVLIDIGFIVSLFLGTKSKNKPLKVFSILFNIACIIPLSIFIFLLLLANGISEP